MSQNGRSEPSVSPYFRPPITMNASAGPKRDDPVHSSSPQTVGDSVNTHSSSTTAINDPPDESTPNLMVDKRALCSALIGFSKLYDNIRFSDLTIKCKDRTWAVHKSYVCTQSEFFARAVEGKFLESETSIVELHDDDPEIIGVILKFFYTFRLVRSETVKTFDHCAVGTSLYLARIFATAEKYMLQHIQEAAAWEFDQCIETSWHFNNTDFTELVPLVYEITRETESMIRQTLLNKVVKHATWFFHESPQAEGFRKMAKETPEFGGAVAARLSAREDERFDD